MKKLRLLFVLLWMTSNLFSSPVTELLERIDKGASSKFIIERQKSETDFFELDQKGDKVIIRGNDYVNIATGLNWYLKYYAGIHLSWNGMTAKLPAVLPPVTKKERHETDLPYRYDQGNNIALPLRPELLYFLLFHGFWGLGALGKGDRLDGASRYQSFPGIDRD